MGTSCIPPCSGSIYTHSPPYDTEERVKLPFGSAASVVCYSWVFAASSQNPCGYRVERAKRFPTDLLVISVTVCVRASVLRCSPVYLSVQPLSQWTSENVLEWLACVNMLAYSDIFKAKEVSGSDLPSLDREKLSVS